MVSKSLIMCSLSAVHQPRRDTGLPESRRGRLLLLRVRDQLFKYLNRRNTRRPKRIVRHVPPDCGRVESILSFPAVHRKHILRGANFYLGSGTLRLSVRRISRLRRIP